MLAHPDYDLGDTTGLDQKIARRAVHEPLAYIRGKTEFYSREFVVNKFTLEPRPETESMVDIVKSIVKSRENLVLADIGTGSGCIAVSVKLELSSVKMLASDVDVKCLEIARENSEKHGANVTFYEGNLLEPIKENIDILLCNLPYVPKDHKLNKAARFEPKHAIFGGKDGLDIYRELFHQIKALHISRYSAEYVTLMEYVLTESLPFQHADLAEIAKNAGYSLERTDDFIQCFHRLTS